MTPAPDKQAVTPNGTRVCFYTSPYRHYTVNEQQVPSVTTILGCLDKPALPWWAQGVAVDGVLELAARRLLYIDAMEPHITDPATGESLAVATTKNVVSLLTREKLTVNHVKSQAGERGTRVHDALEQWATSGVLPDPFALPEAESGYVLALAAFIGHVKPQPKGVEVIVGSPTHRFAGRGDLLWAIVPQPVEVPVRLDKKRDEWGTDLLPAGRYLFDLKTSAGVYDEALLQVEGYEGASVEGGYPATDWRAIIRVGEDGRYEVVRSVATFEDFLAVRRLYDARERLRERRAA